MKAHLAYAKYVFLHKLFVFLACFKMKVPIHLALWHDMSKFTPTEWTPYVYQFFNTDGSKRNVRDASGAYDPNKQSIDFQKAWLHHQKLKHHWQSWVSIGDGGSLNALPIPEIYLREMIADWIGAGRANGKADPHGWYVGNRHNLILHPESRRMLEKLLLDLVM